MIAALTITFALVTGALAAIIDPTLGALASMVALVPALVWALRDRPPSPRTFTKLTE